MARSDSDPVAAAIAATDAELFASALNGDDAVHDDTGDRSLEQQDDGLEGKVEDEGADDTEMEVVGGEAETEAAEGEPADKGPKKDPETGKFVKKDGEVEAEDPVKGRVPSSVVRERTEKANARVAAVEAERDALKAARDEDRREREALKAQMDLLARQVAQRQQPEQPKPEVKATDPEPDMFAQHDEWRAWNRRENDRAISAVREENTKALVNMNLAATREVHGEKFDAAFNALHQAAQTEPEARIAIQKLWHSPNPGAELMRWHRDRETLREVGGDAAAYRQKLQDETRAALLADPEFRKEILAGLKAEAAGGNGAPRHVIRPAARSIPSLNGSSGSSHQNDQAFDGTDDEDFFQRALAG